MTRISRRSIPLTGMNAIMHDQIWMNLVSEQYGPHTILHKVRMAEKTDHWGSNPTWL